MQILRIGKSPQNDVVINDEYVSGYHCQIIQDDKGNFILIDTNSSNGTYVNGVQRRGEVRLNKTDTVRIGNTVLPWQSYFNTKGSPDPSIRKENARKQPQRKGRIAKVLRYGLIPMAFLADWFCLCRFFETRLVP